MASLRVCHVPNAMVRVVFTHYSSQAGQRTRSNFDWALCSAEFDSTRPLNSSSCVDQAALSINRFRHILVGSSRVPATSSFARMRQTQSIWMRNTHISPHFSPPTHRHAPSDAVYALTVAAVAPLPTCVHLDDVVEEEVDLREASGHPPYSQLPMSSPCRALDHRASPGPCTTDPPMAGVATPEPTSASRRSKSGGVDRWGGGGGIGARGG
eukprot:7391024-Prymnesium_polylepis.1